MSYNSLFGNSSHPRTNIHNDPVKANLGAKLNDVRDRVHAQQEIPIFDVNNSVSFQAVSTFGASLLDTTSLADLRTQILESNEEAIRMVPSDGQNEINFYTSGTGASNLRMQITSNSVDLLNNTTLNCLDVVVDPNRSFIGSYIGSDSGQDLRIRRGSSIYQQFTATGINMNENLVFADNKHLKQKIEDNDNRVLVESVAKRQYCLYSHEAGSNSGLLIQATPSDVMKLNNYKNSAASYQPISVNSTTASYLVCGSDINPTSTAANFISNGISLFCNGATPLLDIRSGSIKPYASIVPDGANAHDLGTGANYFGNLHVNSVNLKNDLFLDIFNSTDIKNDGFFFRNGFGSGSGIQDNMSIRGHNNSGANDGIAISAYGGISINCGAINATNDNGTDAATNRVMLLETDINNYRNMLPYADGVIDIGSSSLKFNEIYGNNIRAHTSLYASQIRPYSGSNVHFHSTSITTDNNQSISVDSLFSSATNRDLYLGNGPSAIKMAIRNSGTIEVSVDLNPAYDQAGDLGSASLRYAQIHGMTINAAIQMTTNQIASYDANEIVNVNSVLRAATNNTRSLGDNTNRWTEVYATNGTINTSDRNTKKDITPIKHALDFVRKLKPVQYKWKDGGKRTHTGFIAQDVLQASPLKDQWAGYIDTGNGLGLRYTEFISVNTQAIKELDSKVSRLVNGITGETKVDLNYHTDNSELVERIEALENKKPLAPVVEECDHSKLEEEIKQLKIDNRKQEDCINQLIADNMNLTDKLNMLMERFEKFLNDKPNVELKIVDDSDILLSETGDNDHMEQIEGRLHAVETKLTKVENKQKKITTIVNKLNKQN